MIGILIGVKTCREKQRLIFKLLGVAILEMNADFYKVATKPSNNSYVQDALQKPTIHEFQIKLKMQWKVEKLPSYLKLSPTPISVC